MTILLERKYGRKENQLLMFLYLKKVERGCLKKKDRIKKPNLPVHFLSSFFNRLFGIHLYDV
ncbi:hypothetical protein AKL21_05800 [Enterococcus canintestini]|uniref:Uncharacterized protein n=1 Tax=Enterococcus canintestini TaxID=317010 RepID=A0A267HTD2_9ENTE|nr:hypothetical protein AKL21_05800 [Enterococcus canintestini]